MPIRYQGSNDRLTLRSSSSEEQGDEGTASGMLAAVSPKRWSCLTISPQSCAAKYLCLELTSDMSLDAARMPSGPFN